MRERPHTSPWLLCSPRRRAPSSRCPLLSLRGVPVSSHREGLSGCPVSLPVQRGGDGAVPMILRGEARPCCLTYCLPVLAPRVLRLGNRPWRPRRLPTMGVSAKGPLPRGGVPYLGLTQPGGASPGPTRHLALGKAWRNAGSLVLLKGSQATRHLHRCWAGPRGGLDGGGMPSGRSDSRTTETGHGGWSPGPPASIRAAWGPAPPSPAWPSSRQPKPCTPPVLCPFAPSAGRGL